MRLGFALPQSGPAADPDTVIAVARRAEELGYDSLWVAERLLWPLEPRAPYPGSPDGALPEAMKSQLEALETLSFVAPHTRRVTLGTSVMNLPFYQPLLLARRLATLDVLSGGRLRVGLGNGWLPDEFDAVNVPMRGRGERADEAIEAMKAIWADDPVEFQGKHFRIPRSLIGPKPLQKPHPPIYMGAFAPTALRRVARYADGWNPGALPIPILEQLFERLRQRTEKEGRDPLCLELIVRANLRLFDEPLGERRAAFTGSLAEIRADTDALRGIGAHELFFDVQFEPRVDSEKAFIEHLEQLWELVNA
jgi:probable F420-dependent oxidoreductase